MICIMNNARSIVALVYVLEVLRWLLNLPHLCRGCPPFNASSCFCHSELVEPVRGPGPFASVFLRAEGVCQLPPCPRRYSTSSRRTSQVWHYRFKAITISCNKGLSGRLLDDVVLGGRVPGALQASITSDFLHFGSLNSQRI